MPQQTMMAFKEHGEVRPSLLENVEGARQVLRELAAAGIDHALVSPRQAWDEATFDAVAAILPEVHAIEPERG